MKEKYVKPETEVIELQTECLLFSTSPIPDDPLDILARNEETSYL
ncbi:MAG: hypothetical protein ACI3X9_09745 [Bacteroidaceae bacterium]